MKISLNIDLAQHKGNAFLLLDLSPDQTVSDTGLYCSLAYVAHTRLTGDYKQIKTKGLDILLT